MFVTTIIKLFSSLNWRVIVFLVKKYDQEANWPAKCKCKSRRILEKYALNFQIYDFSLN